MNLKIFVLAFAAFLSPRPAFADMVPLMAEKGSCILTVTPSSTTATQINTSANLTGKPCAAYSQACFTLDDASTQYVYISTHNASVSPGGTISSAAGWPLKGGGYQCFDWHQNVPIWYFMKAGQTPVANTLKFLFSR